MSGIHASPLYSSSAVPGVVDFVDESLTGSSSIVWGVGIDGFVYDNGVRGYAWLTPRSGMQLYEVRATLETDPLVYATSDPINIGTLDVWLAADTGPSWGYNLAGAASDRRLNFEVRAKADPATILDTWFVTLTTTGTTTGGSSGGVGGIGPGGGGGNYEEPRRINDGEPIA